MAPTSHNAIGEDEHVDVVRESTDYEEDGGHYTPGHRHIATAELVGERAH